MISMGPALERGRRGGNEKRETGGGGGRGEGRGERKTNQLSLAKNHMGEIEREESFVNLISLDKRKETTTTTTPTNQGKKEEGGGWFLLIFFFAKGLEGRRGK